MIKVYFLNFKKIIKALQNSNKLILPTLFVYALICAVNGILDLLFIKAIISSIYSPIKNMLLKSVIVIIIAVILVYIEKVLKSYIEYKFIAFRNKLLVMYAKRCVEVDYLYTESKNFIKSAFRAYKAVNNNSTGIEGSCRILSELLKDATMTIVYGIVIINFNWLNFLMVLFYFFINLKIAYQEQYFEYEYEDVVLNLKSNLFYLENVMNDSSFGKDIRIFDVSHLLKEKFTKYSQDLDKMHKIINTKKYKQKSIHFLSKYMLEAGILIPIIFEKGNMILNLGTLFITYQAINNCSNYINRIVDNIFKMAKEAKSVENFFSFLHTENDCKSELKSLKTTPRICKNISLEKVSWGYNENDITNNHNYILNNINLEARKGQRIAIVGANGAGKSTLMNVIAGLIQPQHGTVKINDIDIHCYDKQKYFTLISPIFQESFILATSIKENIMLQEEDTIKFAKVIELSNLKGKIANLKCNENTYISKNLSNDGIELSGGEIQKLLLARALYKDGEIFIFDEPTANLDPLAESVWYKNFSDLTKNKITFFVSHRLLSTKFCDSIILLSEGKIIAQGTHKDLLKTSPDYAKLFDIQAKYYQKQI